MGEQSPAQPRLTPQFCLSTTILRGALALLPFCPSAPTRGCAAANTCLSLQIFCGYLEVRSTTPSRRTSTPS